MRNVRYERVEEAIVGTAAVGRNTKQVLRKARPRQILVLDHRDLDEMAAISIIELKCIAVINAAPSMSGDYPTKGPLLLLQAGIPIFEIEPPLFTLFEDEMRIIIARHITSLDSKQISIPYTCFTLEKWEALHQIADNNVGARLSDFIDNTLKYAQKEKDFVIHPLNVPPLRTVMDNKHVVVVVRGSGYKNDLQALKDYIEDYQPVLIGVDGGADALMEYGHVPDLIVGDMDSVSDEALRHGKEIIVHAYPDGRAPGMTRVQALGLKAEKIPSYGTSEDVAMLLAYEQKAELIVTLGTHTHMIDFLEKGRKGMSSTILVRMKIGSKLVDAKGVSKLYHRPMRWRSLWMVPAAALFPLMMLGLIHPGIHHVADVLLAYLKVSIH
ncbi:MAG: putative cytokinetic ring protein SteA [Paenibacillaceae bacterium]